MKRIIWACCMTLCFLLIGCADDKNAADRIVVLVTYKAQPNKSVEAVTALQQLIEQVKKEDHYVSVTLHVDPDDNSNIMLYEVWDDVFYYKNPHMKTEYMQQFILDSEAFLMGAPSVTFWKVNGVY